MVIHDAVRRDLARLDAALGEFRDGDADRARELGRSCAHLRAGLEQEQDLVRPVLARLDVDPGTLATLRCEQHAATDALREVAEALARLVREPTARTARAAQRVVSAAREVVEQHHVHQEHLLGPARPWGRTGRRLARLTLKHANPRRLP